MTKGAGETKPEVGISACLTGMAVRYDGRDKHTPDLLKQLTQAFTLFPFCPEVAIGLGTPRPPIDIWEVAGERVIYKQGNPAPAIGEELKAVAREVSLRQGLCGYVLTERSPSCGLGSTPVYRGGGIKSGTESGLFAAELSITKPGLPMVEATQLETSGALDEFIAAVYNYFEATRRKTGGLS